MIHIEANLDASLDLLTLANRAGLSPTHFLRCFKAICGETPKQCVARLRLERAAFLLLVRDSTILEIGLDVGFSNHETFTRAFRRRFGLTPSAFRAGAMTRFGSTEEPATPTPADHFSLSRTSVRSLRPAHLAFVRHVGPYENVPGSIFDLLDDWAVSRKLSGPRIWLGIGHDAPGTTDSSRLRFDAALVAPASFRPIGSIGYRLFTGGEYAVTTHVGAYSSLPAAYAAIFPRVIRLPHHELVGLPAVELYQTAKVNATLTLNVTDICLPVRRRPLVAHPERL